MRLARSSFRGGTLGTPFLLRILCLFCCYATAFKDYFLLRYLFKYDFNSVSKFIIIFLLSILFFVLPELDRKTKRFKLERHFVKRKHREGIYLVCELRSA